MKIECVLQDNEMLKQALKQAKHEYDVLEKYYERAIAYNNELDGITYGFNSGIASSLVGNTVLETSNELENGIDIYEPLRDCVQDLNNKIGADATIRLCSSITLEDFATYYSEIGLQSLEEFLDQTTYLLKNGINITEKQSEGLVTDIKNSQPAVEIALNPAKSLG